MDTNRFSAEEFWTAVAERSGDTAFELARALPKRRGASLPAAVQDADPNNDASMSIRVHWCQFVVCIFFTAVSSK